MILQKSIRVIFVIALLTLFLSPVIRSQDNQPFQLTAAKLENKPVDLTKIKWKYQAGDDAAWAAPDYDNAAWEEIEGTKINLQSPPSSGWSGRGWFRLRLTVEPQLADRTLALIGRQVGASEIYLDGKQLVKFGEIGANGAADTEYNPTSLPIPFKFGSAGEHTIAVRYSLSSLDDATSIWGKWAAINGIAPSFALALKDVSDIGTEIQDYANSTAGRIPYLFVGVLAALALVHFLLYAFYRTERANLFYSVYAAAFAVNLICGNLVSFGHQGFTSRVIISSIANLAISTVLVALLAFLHVAFGRPFDWRFRAIALLWMVSIVTTWIFPNGYGLFSSDSDRGGDTDFRIRHIFAHQSTARKTTGRVDFNGRRADFRFFDLCGSGDSILAN